MCDIFNIFIGILIKNQVSADENDFMVLTEEYNEIG